MNKKTKIVFINVLLMMVMVAFNNCGQPGDIRMEAPPIIQASGGDNGIAGADPANPDNSGQPGGAQPSGPGQPMQPGLPSMPGSPVVSDPMTTYPQMYQKMEKVITATETQKADILFVVDNSISMGDEQSNMSARFPAFIQNISSLDWRVGIITTDIQNSSLPTGDGRLLLFPNSNSYIDSHLPSAEAESHFAKTIQRSESGSGWEQGIFATYRFLERDLSSNLPFMRNDASVNIVIISDADETPFVDDKGNIIVNKRNSPSELLAYMASKWPMKKFQFHSIVVKDQDEDCLGRSENEAYGTTYEKLADLTKGIKGSVCAADYGSQLLFMSEKIKQLVNTIALECGPAIDPKTQKAMISLKKDGIEPVEFEKVEGKVAYIKGALPLGTFNLEYFCPKEKVSN